MTTGWMSKDRRAPGALIIDPDRDRIDQWKSEEFAEAVPIHSASSGLEAMTALEAPSRTFVGIFINPQISWPGGLRILEKAHQTHPGVPIWFLHKTRPDIPVQIHPRLGVQRSLPIPERYHQLSPLLESAFLYARSARSRLSTDPAHIRPVPPVHPGYVSVDARSLLSGNPSLFDLYVRLDSGRYLKICNAGESLLPDRTARYLDKGIVSFFIKKEEIDAIIGSCRKLQLRLQEAAEVSMEMKIIDGMGEAEELIREIILGGLSSQKLEQAQEVIRKIHIITQRLAKLNFRSPEARSAITTLVQNAALHEHAVGTLMVASLMTIPLRIQSYHIFEMIGVAAFLHDVGLYELPSEIQSGDLGTMNEKEKLLYRNHPLRSAEILNQVGKVKPVCIQAVAQHHERFNNSGFPLGIAADSINRIAEIIGISDTFVRVLQKSRAGENWEGSEGPLNPVDWMRTRGVKSFSHPVVSSFISVLGPILATRIYSPPNVLPESEEAEETDGETEELLVA